jgi:hypothetical protein
MGGFYIDTDGNLHTGTTGKLIDDTLGDLDWLPLLRQIVDLKRFASTGRFTLNITSGSTFATVAAAGNSQVTATPMPANADVTVSAGAAGLGVLVPNTMSTGDQLYVNTELANFSVNVYPPVGSQIDSLGVNAPLVLASDRRATLTKTGSTAFTSSVQAYS